MFIKKFKPTINEMCLLILLVLIFTYFFIGLLIWVNGAMLSREYVLTKENYKEYYSVNTFNLFPRIHTSITFSLDYIGNKNEDNNAAREFLWEFRAKHFIDFNIQYVNEQENLKLALGNFTDISIKKEDFFIEYSSRAGGKRYNFWDPVNVGFVRYEINLEPEILEKLLQYYNLTIEADFICPSETLTAVYCIFAILYFVYGIPVIPLFLLILITMSVPIFCLILKIVERSNHVKSHTI